MTRRCAGRCLAPLAALWFGPLALGCALSSLDRTPVGEVQWQDPAPPQLSLAAKAAAYQAQLDERARMPEGVIRYRAFVGQASDDYGDLADGPFFAGLHLASQALRFATTGEPAARRECERTLDGMATLMEVTGSPGLLARWVAPRVPAVTDSPWRASTTRPGLFWRGDVSKDQLAGYASGLGTLLALVPDPALRARAAALAVALADHLLRNDLRIVDVTGERTTHGELAARVLGFPVGVNAAIALAVAEAAAASGDDRLAREIARRGFERPLRWAHVRPPGNTKRVNENMAYVSLLPLLLGAEPLPAARVAEARLWGEVHGEHNAFFAGVHELASGDASARAEVRAALAEFPDRKIDGPVDLTRPGFAFETRWLRSREGFPRAVLPVPLYLRPSGSNLWVSDPYALIGSQKVRPPIEYSGVDYLLAYWLARARGVVGPND